MINSKENIESLIYHINLQLAEDAKNLCANLMYGFPYKRDEHKLLKLSIYANVLYEIFQGSSCLLTCRQEILWDKLSKVLGQNCHSLINYNHSSGEVFKMNRRDIYIDDSKRNEWNILNPYAVNREKWEKLYYEVLSPISYTYEEKIIACDITFNILKDKVPIEVLLGILVSNVACALNYNLSKKKLKIIDMPRVTNNPIICTIDSEITLKDLSCKLKTELKQILKDCRKDFQINNDYIDCAAYYKIFNQKHCDKLDYSTYSKLIDCNISPQLINLIFDNNLNIYTDSEGNPIFFTGNCEYNLNDGNFLGAINNQLLQLMLKYPMDDVLKPYLENPEEFILNLGSDYDLDEELLNLLLGNNDES